MNVPKTGSLIAVIRKEQIHTQQDLANELDYCYYCCCSLFDDFCNITQVGDNLGGLDCILFLSNFMQTYL